MLTAERLREVLRYDPDSGLFYWRDQAGRKSSKPAGCLRQQKSTWIVYRRIRIDRRLHYAHRLAWMYEHGEWPSGSLDHIDRDGTNNRLENLRIATQSQNNANSTARAASGFKGVYAVGRRWRARIKVAGQNRSLGTFATAEAAGNAYAEAAREAFGEFARPSA